ncbi:MAG: hypothetical protein J5685_08470 [Clostridiales bacterium]|nr:hypothetical protein [Clostridiales bacterium]
MNPGLVLALVFFLLSLGTLLFLIFSKSPFFADYKKFYIMSSAIYLSGTVLILLFFIFIDLPVLFAVISELCILSVFIICTWAIRRMGKAIKEIDQANENKNKEEAQDVS